VLAGAIGFESAWKTLAPLFFGAKDFSDQMDDCLTNWNRPAANGQNGFEINRCIVAR
jgi:hypothetical protein